ncbi:MAG: rod shape-determining protein RodA [Bacteroidetes bacterium GWF2_38_335]|nr:MAG: rod shape-determining protein RodA [Bacteroidetes bacterium GWF2_38_335]OFY77431.1 MAG: rod shape-determining protein RodA [Bacteroidetes bacterium RIFOXYA12_FULL_38_20]HBS87280.1 rod shape-determining protein RodA [Bacteroidales bacterium]
MRRNINVITSVDWLTIFLYLLLVLLGWINIYSAVYDDEHKSIFDFTQRYGKQIIFIAAAVFIAVCLLIIESNFYSLFAYGIYALMILLLISVLFLGKEVNGSRSWFEMGEVRLQPAEFAKFATCLALARLLSDHNFRFRDRKFVARIILIIMLPVGLILLQRDAGSALVYYLFIIVLYREGMPALIFFLGLAIPVLFVVTLLFDKIYLFVFLLSLFYIFFYAMYLNLKHLGISLAIFTGSVLLAISYFFINNQETDWSYVLLVSFGLSSLVYFFLEFRYKLRNAFIINMIVLCSIGFTFTVDYVYNNVLHKHQKIRIDVLLGLDQDVKGVGYNVNQSMIAIGSGGPFGKGFLHGTQTKLNYVPEQDTDFIFCTVGEEWGFTGSVFVLLLFAFLLIRLIYLAERQRSVFSRVYGYGVVAILFFHLAINIGMTIGLAPVIGIPLPFFSYGGSSLWAFTILIFIFLRLDSSRMQLL